MNKSYICDKCGLYIQEDSHFCLKDPKNYGERIEALEYQYKLSEAIDIERIYEAIQAFDKIKNKESLIKNEQIKEFAKDLNKKPREFWIIRTTYPVHPDDLTNNGIRYEVVEKTKPKFIRLEGQEVIHVCEVPDEHLQEHDGRLYSYSEGDPNHKLYFTKKQTKPNDPKWICAHCGLQSDRPKVHEHTMIPDKFGPVMCPGSFVREG